MKLRPASWGSHISWDKADPFGVSSQGFMSAAVHIHWGPCQIFYFSIYLKSNFKQPPVSHVAELVRCHVVMIEVF